MKAADEQTIAAGTPGTVLMERAGRAVARVVREVAGGRYGRNVLVVCGKGNNGGDGFVVARVLACEGLGVTCMLTFDPAEAKGDAAEQLRSMTAAGVVAEAFDKAADTEAYDVVVDAIFGTGFSGRAEGVAREAIELIDGHPAIVAIDIPSGVDGLTGRVDGPAVHALRTVAMAAEKIGTALPPGAVHAGAVEVIDIGIDTDIRKFEQSGGGVVVDSFVEMIEAADVAAALVPRSAMAHKRSVGSVAILAGSDQIRGAALLTARGAIRMGSGYVTLASTKAVKAAAAISLPELICKQAGKDGVLGPDALDDLGPELERSDAFAVGPGMGTGPQQRGLVERVLREVAKPLVLDADALNVLAEDPEPLRARTSPTVITPHPAELARLLGISTEEVVADRLTAALEAARRFPSVVVLCKGFRTIVAYGGGKVAVVVPVGGAELATAGTGDVLTGAIAARLAEGSPPVAAALTAAYIHGLAGAVAAQRIGSPGLVAGEVADALPEAAELIRATPLE
jgi:NAD(P)H-hydrate epimerase